jgi:hypothetical protein
MFPEPAIHLAGVDLERFLRTVGILRVAEARQIECRLHSRRRTTQVGPFHAGGIQDLDFRIVRGIAGYWIYLLER